MLRLRSDEQLVSLMRAGSHEAFRAIHERYGQRLFAYVRQMLGPGSRQDAEDVLQDVFARTYTTLRTDDREINLRPWLYRVAHNRCIDHLRRPGPATTELVENSGKPLHDPFEEVQRRQDLQRLVSDISRLPDQQRSALLLREINGLSYRELAETLEVSVPAVKSLLVRARVELVETAEARDTSCAGIREELSLSCDERSARQSPRVRRHVRDCAGCREYQAGIRGMRRSFAALSPVAAAGPLAALAKLVGLGSGGGSGGAGAGAGAGAGGLAGGVTSGGLAVGTAGKIAAVASTAAIAAGGAVEIERRSDERAKAGPGTEAAAPAAGSNANGSQPAALRGTSNGPVAIGIPAGDRTGNAGGAPVAGERGGDPMTEGATGIPAGAAAPAGSAPAGDPSAPAAGDQPAGEAPAGDRTAGIPTPGVVGGGGSGDFGGDGARGGGDDAPSRAGSPGRPVRAPEAPADRPRALKPPSVDTTAPRPVVPPVKDKVGGSQPKPGKADRPKPEKVADPRPGDGPPPKVERIPAPKVDEAPGPKADKVPGPKVDREPGPKADKVPGPKVDKVPGPKVEKVVPPRKVEKAPPPPKIDKLPPGKAERAPGPKVEKVPELRPVSAPEPKADKPPVPKAEKSPAPKAERSPAPKAEKSPAPKVPIPERVADAKPEKVPGPKPGRGPKVELVP